MDGFNDDNDKFIAICCKLKYLLYTYVHKKINNYVNNT